MAKKGSRKKLPKEVAIINADNCTGCEACLEVCPVDCIYKVEGETFGPLQSWCEIDVERCVGCEVCVHIPTKKSDPYELLVCPWDAIEMVPTITVAGPRDQRNVGCIQRPSTRDALKRIAARGERRWTNNNSSQMLSATQAGRANRGR